MLFITFERLGKKALVEEAPAKLRCTCYDQKAAAVRVAEEE